VAGDNSMLAGGEGCNLPIRQVVAGPAVPLRWADFCVYKTPFSAHLGRRIAARFRWADFCVYETPFSPHRHYRSESAGGKLADQGVGVTRGAREDKRRAAIRLPSQLLKPPHPRLPSQGYES
jgi:hypothetical protein